jgi:hypothetical protein
MKLCHDDLNARHIFTAMHVDWHASAIVTYLKRSIIVINDTDSGGEPGDCFINGIINDLLGQMIRPRGIGIHSGSASDRIETLQYF